MRLSALLLASVLSAACFTSDAPDVEVGAAGSGSVTERIPAPGTVRAGARQEVAAGVGGTVAALPVEDGDRVRAGQTVVVLRSPQVQRALRQARRAVQQAGATPSASAPPPDVSGALAAPPRPQIELPNPGPAARAAAARTVDELDEQVLPALRDARRRLPRIEDRPQRRAGRQTVETIARSYEVTRAAILSAGRSAAARQQAVAATVTSTIEEALAQLAAAQQAQAQALAAVLRSQAEAAASVGEAQSQAAARAAREQATAALAAARTQRAALTVTAPFAGTVELGPASPAGGMEPTDQLPDELSDLTGAAGATGLTGSKDGGTLRPGAPVAAGQTLFTVYDLSQLFVRAEVDEIDVAHIRPGQRARVVIDAFGERTYEGVVESVATTPETAATGGVAYPTDVLLTNVPRGARPRVGMTASVEVATRTVDAALTVPSRAIVQRGGASAVYVVRQGRAELENVRVLLLGPAQAVVEGELQPDELVVTSGYEELEDGQQVDVQ